jgi:hypothetical protein
MDRAAVRLVVERDVPGDDRTPEGLGCGCDSFDGLGELPADFRLLRIAEVETVREAERLAADTGDVARGLENRERPAHERVERGDPPLAVQADREPPHRRPQAQHGCVESRPPNRPRAHELVVAAEDELATSQRRRRQQLEEGVLVRGCTDDLSGLRGSPRLAGNLVARALVGEQPRRYHADGLPVPERLQLPGVRDLADDRVLELPPVEDGVDRLDPVRADDRDHPLLALGDHHLPGLHSLLPERHAVQVDVDAEIRRHLGERRRDPRGAAILKRLDETGLHELHRRLDELLPGEGIADLDRGPLLGGAVVELLAREHGGAADSVSTGRRTVEDDRVTGRSRLRAEQPLCREEPDAHRIHKAVVAVGLVEDHLAADGRHADAVAVVADASDRSREVPIGLAEAEAVEKRDGPRAHGHDVAQNPSHSGRGPLERLDGRGVVVALDLERDRESVAEVEHTGVLAGPLQDPLARAR